MPVCLHAYNYGQILRESYEKGEGECMTGIAQLHMNTLLWFSRLKEASLDRTSEQATVKRFYTHLILVKLLMAKNTRSQQLIPE